MFRGIASYPHIPFNQVQSERLTQKVPTSIFNNDATIFDQDQSQSITMTLQLVQISWIYDYVYHDYVTVAMQSRSR